MRAKLVARPQDWKWSSVRAHLAGVDDALVTVRPVLDRIPQLKGLLEADEEDQSSVIYQKLAQLGWLGIAIPEEYGGSGGTYVEQTILFEELWRGLAPVKALGPTTTVAGCYKRFGSEEQKRDALAAIAGGAIMSISISEPGAGSDVAAIACRADAIADGYVLNGQKTWCSYAHRAERILLVARTSRDGKPHAGLTIFEVPRNTEGIETRRISTLGGREVNDVFFTDCFVPAENVVGEIGRGFGQIMAGLDGGRGPGHRPARAGRHHRVRQGAQAVRESYRHVSGTAPPHRRSRHRTRMRPPTDLRGRRATRTRGRSGDDPHDVDGQDQDLRGSQTRWRACR